MSLTAGAIKALTTLTKPLPDAPTVQVLGLVRYLVDPTFRPATALVLPPFVTAENQVAVAHPLPIMQ